MEGKTNGLQIAGFVVSLVSCFIFGFYGITGAVGLVLSAIGRSKAKEVGGATGLGTAGIVIGIIMNINMRRFRCFFGSGTLRIKKARKFPAVR